MIQSPKKLVDTGTEGVEGTGDTLYDGGTSLNQNLNSLYNVFGDYRKFKGDAGQGNQVMTLHPNGYYQKHTRAYYAGGENPSGNPVEFGSMHDISVTRDGAGDLIVSVPAGTGHQGEYIEFINMDGSVGFGAGKELIIRCVGTGDTIKGHGSQMKVQKSHFILRLWVEKEDQTGSIWSFKYDSLYGDNSIPYQSELLNIASGTSKQATLFNKSQFNVTKHLIYAVERDVNSQVEAAETMIMVNNTNQLDTNVYHTEYARIRSNAPANPVNDLLYTAGYSIVGSNVIITVTNLSNLAIDVYVKAIEAIGG